jgi:Right handed beta helix region
MSKHLLYYTDLVNRTLTRSLLFVLTRLASCLIVLIQAISPTQAAEVATRAAGMNLIIPLIFFLLSLTTAQAATYWAHPNGTSTNCAANRGSDPKHANPANYLDFINRRAIPCLSGGDTLMLKPGEYWYHWDVWKDLQPGTPSAYTTIRGSTGNYNDVKLMIGAWYAGILDSTQQRYIEFGHMTFDGSPRSNETKVTLWHVGSNLFHQIPQCLNDLEVDDCGGAAYIRFRNTKIDGGFNPRPDDWLSTNSQGMGVLGCGKCEFLGGEITRNVYGLYLAGERNVIDGVWIHHNLLYGIQVYNGAVNNCQGCTWQGWQLAHHQIIRNNLFQWNGATTTTRSDSLCGNPHIVVGSGKGSVVYNNVFDDGSITPCTPDRPDAIQIFGGCLDCEVYNNTITRANGAISLSPNVSGLRIRNNLLSQLNGPLVRDHSSGESTYTESNNITVSSSSFVNMTGGNWQLTPGSPAINAGASLGSPFNVDANGVSRPQGGAWDI